MKHCLIAVLLALPVLSACENEAASGGSHFVETLSGTPVVREYDAGRLRFGEAVYRQHCADCHGTQAEGAKDWRKRDAQGFYPPPPLNGSGHAWHHPGRTLRDMIRNGSGRDEQGRLQGGMPAWQGKLAEHEIDAVVIWLQSLWPDPVYAAWAERIERTAENR